MKIIKNILLRGHSSLLSVFMALLGFTSACDSFRSSQDEYGCPSATFVVNGQVTSSENSQTIPGIRVIMGNSIDFPDTAYTDTDGKYEVSIVEIPGDQSFLLKFDDTDGESNGEFENKEVLVDFADPEYSGGSGTWYKGEAVKNLNPTMTPKNARK